MSADWARPDGDLARYVNAETQNTLRSYAAQSKHLRSYAEEETDLATGGYAHRQVLELVQNSADALLTAASGRIEVRLSGTTLYCADAGTPLDGPGMDSVMFSRMSPKRGTGAIGKFGLGFKSVLGVSESPEFFSRSGSFRFSRETAVERIREFVPDAQYFPALRLPVSIEPEAEAAEDEVLRGLMTWANNIVRLPLKAGAHSELLEQLEAFPAEFVLFVPHVKTLCLAADGAALQNNIKWCWRKRGQSAREGLLFDGEREQPWRVVECVHRVSATAASDRREGETDDLVPIWWAAPLKNLRGPGDFWAFFPTSTASLVAGIVNAPWKTNNDRQNLLPGPYNDELIDRAARLVAESLPALATKEDPALHLDALPRRKESGDSEQAERLRQHIYKVVRDSAVLPDQDGRLRVPSDLKYPPTALTDRTEGAVAALERWEATSGRPAGWIHHRALGRERLAKIDQMFPAKEGFYLPGGAPRADVAEWLGALVGASSEVLPVAESRAAIAIAVLIQPRNPRCEVGPIVLTATGAWKNPKDENLFFSDDVVLEDETDGDWVHPDLVSDPGTLDALRKLGVKAVSSEEKFRRLARRMAQLDNDSWPEFWRLAAEVADEAPRVIRRRSGWRSHLRVRTVDGGWGPVHSVLLPGPVVPGDGSRDGSVAVDVEHPGHSVAVLGRLEVAAAPEPGRELSWEPWFGAICWRARREWRDANDNRRVWDSSLSFASSKGTGPLVVLLHLSDEGRAAHTWALLTSDSVFDAWILQHDAWSQQKTVSLLSPSVAHLKEHGRIETSAGFVPFTDALGKKPKSEDALRVLLRHPNAERIREYFQLAVPEPEVFGDEDAVLLLDEWPGLREIRPHRRLESVHIVRCGTVRVLDDERLGALYGETVFLQSAEDPGRELREVARILDFGLSDSELRRVLDWRVSKEIEAARKRVLDQTTDEGRLLAAVGADSVRRRLPRPLLTILESDGGRADDLLIAAAAVACFGTDALWECRSDLSRLGPPGTWTGSRPAVKFVRDLGFAPEWAGERIAKEPPFEEVDGPYSFPDLHPYQRQIVDNTRAMLRAGAGGRRGLISMPTGSGKTRVAVQSIIEAVRDDALEGPVLWVADRGELCEQAVAAWRQAWSSTGPGRQRLRISRMWKGQPTAESTDDFHVVVGTIQTLRRRIGSVVPPRVVVFDEAHGSIAPSYTRVMTAVGFRRRRDEDDPLLLGLTATPYRGHDEAETQRLANRYDGRRLDAGAFCSDDARDVIGELQAMEVLAQADHDTIPGGTFALSPDELREATDLPWLPEGVERRIGEDPVRTLGIIAAYEQHVGRLHPEWPTLIFATSVDHAKTVATLLNGKGVSSAWVSGATKPAIRRRAVRDFREGQLGVLVNYGVFREGFDAPLTQAIIVARPVYSPNLYFQMVGRGLRGPKNGGSERCLILNVEDNIENYEKHLAFTDLDWLWASSDSS